MMTRLQIAVLLADLIEMLRVRGGWSGETHIQKCAYVAQSLAGIPLGFNFILYKHGPFSFDLRDELVALRADQLLVLEPQPFPYGPKFNVTETARELRKRFPKTRRRYEQRLAFISQQFANRQVDQLERLATALFAKRKFPESDDRERAEWIHERKRHVSIMEAMDALKEIDRFQGAFETTLA
jgi:hypothetical protein